MSLNLLAKHEVSPFVVDIKKRKKSVVSSNVGSIYSNVSGELISENVAITVQKAIDKSEFVKLFTKDISRFLQIKTSEIAVFLYLTKNLQMNNGRAFFDLQECKRFTGFQKAWVYKSLSALCKNGFIARTKNNSYYWVNPSIVFNGSRLFIERT